MTELRRILLLLSLFLWGAAPAPRATLVIEEIPSPAGRSSQTPFLSTGNSAVYASWQEETKPGQTDLLFASWNGKQWSKPAAIVSGAPLFRNWADFPSIVPAGAGMLAAHWLQRAGDNTYAYDAMFSFSRDSGKTWNAPVRMHKDNVKNEHGFVSLIPLGEDRVMAVWLDSRKFKPGSAEGAPGNEMQLMAGVYDGKAFLSEIVLDPRTCDCCQTAGVAVPGGAIVAYRDRSEAEIRDISYVRFNNGKWSAPKTLNADGWKINGCPVNGPAAASLDNKVVISWFTAAGDKPRVQAVFSTDGGATFGRPVRIDGGNPTGRVDAEFLSDGSAVVSWLENTTGKGAEILVRRILPDGTAEPALNVAESTTARAGGFPRMTRWQNGALLAWTDVGNETSRVRVVSLNPK